MRLVLVLVFLCLGQVARAERVIATGDLGVVIERATGS